MNDETLYGGQAVIEGVMMRSHTHFATAVRTPNGEIVVQKGPIRPLTDRWRVLKAPFLRGTFVLIDALILGIKALNFSANAAAEAQHSKGGARAETSEGAPQERSPKRAVPAVATACSIAMGLALGIVLFVALPVLLTKWLKTAMGTGDFASTVLLGCVKMVFFLGYVIAISQLPYIKRVFEYHGAEHMVIHAYEAGRELTAENVQGFSPRHPRCGSSFVALVIVVSVAVFAFVGWSSVIRRLALEIIALPIIAGISYELLRAAGRGKRSRLLRAICQPGMWLQALTTREPHADQIEVAIRAFNEAREAGAPAVQTGGEAAAR